MATIPKKGKDAVKGKKKSIPAKGRSKDKAKDDVCVIEELVVEEKTWCCDDECCCLM
jgi:hypothetical protein